MKAGRIELLKALEKKLDVQAQTLGARIAGISAGPEYQRISSAYLQLARDMTRAGLSEEGLAAYRKAREADPENLEADYFFLLRLEKLNRVEEAWAGLLAVEARHRSPYALCRKLYFLKGCLEYRRGNLETARQLLETFIAQNAASSSLAHAYGWLGKTLERLGEHDGAMEAFSRCNAMIAGTPVAQAMLKKLDDTQSAIETSLRWYSGQTSFGWEEDHAFQGPSPILLVGFPRSGTTLLDQILNSHSALSTIEEKPTLQGIADQFYGSAEKLLALQQAGGQELAECRRLYWANVERFLENGFAPGAQVVDKVPLNIMHLDLYARLFPKAKIIVALRDPRDCILSNYFQLYRLNPSMAANLSLTGSAAYYAKVMALYLRFRAMLPDNIHEVRYESVVRNFKGECARLLEFLGLEWEDSLERYHENARKRWINTPSYDQVTQPLYDRAIGRWKKYASHLEGVSLPLQPFIEAFGYSREDYPQ